MTNYQLICGAEIHVELKTQSKMFCGCQNDPFHAPEPNIYTCPVCLGLPGALVSLPNQRAIESVILLGLALHSEIAEVSKFDRKHYFYPDLPKGYQISQYDQPLCKGGYVDTSFGRVNITRIHLEEDTAKLQHAEVDGKKVSLIDFNRSSVPLMEIVTEPDIHSAEQAKEFLKKIRDIVRSLGISDADMEKGTMRLEANISLSPDGKLPSYKVEVKNINSFRFYGLAIESEIKRQSELLDKGETPKQETRGYRADTSSTASQRSKEDAADYRYFPEPDLPPLTITPEIVESLRARLPVLPDQAVDELVKQGISASAAKILTQNPEMMLFIEQVKKINEKYLVNAANALVNKKVDHKQVSPEEYIKKLESSGADKITDESILKPMIEKILNDNPQVVTDYQGGKVTALGYFVGQVMKASGGKADTQRVAQMLQELLK
jgi:aspartyl-tRNA(Asn)/glutamyl-tRNA(Gln) amidotransferase subunit B